MAVGNGRGLCGIGSSRALLQRSALTSARNKAARRLHYFELCDGRTIFHNAFVQHLATRIYAYPAPPGASSLPFFSFLLLFDSFLLFSSCSLCLSLHTVSFYRYD